ncbi:tyrosine-type recombinase/integrase [Crenothrix polyspora]|uniref:Putative integrase DLP12 prophage n=1 Tax=Crenothrix polyspora TaxID=360316 RepID=A0A1R4HFG4_9GAMM|nr:site-specific integrase [Crenothrix polyspora]SJM94964.1 putative integrase; DLP12 prophage [Crenothrix polyspora]
MSIYKRGETWWIQFKTPNGERIQQSAWTQVKEEAQELHDTLKAQAWREKNLGARPRHTWQEAVVRWLTEQSHKKSIETDKTRLRWLDQHLHDTKIDEITKTMVDAIKTAKQNEGVSNATINRTLAILRSILNKSKQEWEWIDSVPYIRMLPEPSMRVRWLSYIEADRLISELPDHLKAMVKFTLATGLRESNVTGLQWKQVDMIRRCAWVNADQAKGKKAIAVPLNSDSCEIIKEQFGKHETYVFTYKGNPVTRANNNAWEKALKRAGIEDFRWHDLRHTWASWHIQSGTPLNVLKELGGWSDLTMVMRYAHLSSEHLYEYAGNVSKKNTGTNLVLVKGLK